MSTEPLVPAPAGAEARARMSGVGVVLLLGWAAIVYASYILGYLG